MIHVDLKQPLGRRIGVVARDPKLLLLGALKDPAILAAVFVAFAAGTSTVALESQLSAREQEIEVALAEAEAESARLGDALDRADELKAEQERLERRVSAIQTLDPDRYAFVRLMDQVATAVPENTWMDALVIDARDKVDGSLRFRMRGYSPSVDLVGQVQRGLRETGTVHSLQMTGSGSMQLGEVPVIRFELSGVAAAAATEGPMGVSVSAMNSGYFQNEADIVIAENRQ